MEFQDKTKETQTVGERTSLDVVSYLQMTIVMDPVESIDLGCIHTNAVHVASASS